MSNLLKTFTFACGLAIMATSIFLPEINTLNILVTIPAMCLGMTGGAILLAIALGNYS